MNENYSNLPKKLRASVNLDAINGNEMERSVCASQMLQAAKVIEKLENQCQDYYNKLTEWQEYTGCQCPTEVKNKILERAYDWWNDNIKKVRNKKI